MADWAWVIAEPDGTEIIDVTHATGRALSFDLVEPHSAQWTTRGDDTSAYGATEMATDLIVYRDGAKIFRGRLGASKDTIDANGHNVEWSAVAYKGLLKRRVSWVDGDVTPPIAWLVGNIDLADAAWWGLQTYQRGDIDGADLGITNGTTPTGVIVPHFGFVSVNEPLSDALDRLAATYGGFDWDVGADQVFRMWRPRRGTTVSWAAVWGDTIATLARTVEPGGYATDIIGLGSDKGDGGNPRPDPVRRGITPHGPAGRWETVLAWSDITDQTQLEALTEAALDDTSTITPAYEVTLRPGTWTPDDAWVGDTIRLVVQSGRLDINTTARILGIDWTLGDDGDETVKLTLDRRPLDVLDRIGTMQDQLLALTRR